MYKHMLCFLAVVTVLFVALPARATEITLHRFCSETNCKDGKNPAADLVADANGNVYGTTSAGGSTACTGGGCGVVFTLQPGAGKANKYGFQVLYSFQGGLDGANPAAGLVFDSHGNLYGTTAAGGGASACTGGCGIVFVLCAPGNTVPAPCSRAATWQEFVLYKFKGQSFGDGANPLAELIVDASGNLYGTTENGGAYGNGTVFKTSPAPGGTFTTTILHSFAGVGDGANPRSGLAFDAQFNFWGTAKNGGANGLGTIFEVTAAPNFRFVPIYAFNGSDGAFPFAALVLSMVDGNFYGTTSAGGSGSCSGGCGTVFELPPANPVPATIYAFTGGKDGAAPVARLTVETDNSNDNYGSLYGTASRGGSTAGVCGASGCGTAVEICPLTQSCPWRETTLFRFAGSNGEDPAAGLLLFPPSPAEANAGPLQTGRGTCTGSCIGTGSQGGSENAGVVNQITGP